jgi:RecA-family ATPase
VADQKFPDPIKGVIPFGTVNVFAGAPGVGKTAMIMDWIARMLTNRTIWGYQTSAPTGIYYIAADRQWRSHARWLELAGIPEGTVKHYSIADDAQLDLGRISNAGDALEFFAYCLEKLDPQPGGFLVIDPGSPIFIAGSPNSSRDVARTLLTLSRIAQHKQITIILSAHFGKQSGDTKDRYVRPQDRIAGSVAFSGFSDTQIYLVDPEPQNDQPFHIMGWVPRHQAPEEFRCVRGPNGLFVPWDTVQEDERSQRVLDAFDKDGEAVTIGELVLRCLERYQYHRMVVRRALDQLLKHRRIVKLGRGKYIRAKIH